MMTSIVDPKLVQILLIEDSDNDAFLMYSSLEKYKVKPKMERVRDGEEAIRYLNHEAPFEQAQRPDIIFLDLNLPKLNGFEVLRKIRENPDIETIPVIVLSSSEADQDIIKSYKLHANAYVNKPVNFTEFQQVVTTISDFWFTIVKIAQKEPVH